MKAELKTIRQQRLKHGFDLRRGGRVFSRCAGGDVVAIFVHPSCTAGNLIWFQLIGVHDQAEQRVSRHCHSRTRNQEATSVIAAVCCRIDATSNVGVESRGWAASGCWARPTAIATKEIGLIAPSSHATMKLG